MKNILLITILLLSVLIANAQTKKSFADSLYHHDNGARIYLKSEIDSMPKYPKGENEMFSILAKNIHYPPDAKESGIQGTVYASFVVEINGDITDFKIIKGLNASCDLEVKRLLGFLSNGWTPALKGGQPVRFQYIMPIKFKLQ